MNARPQAHVHPRARQSGVALVVVLWAGALMMLAATSLTFEVRTEVALARTAVDQARAAALAEGAVRRAVLGMMEPRRERRWRADGHVYELPLGDGTMRVSVRSERGKIDLNAAPEALLEGLVVLAADESLELEDPARVDALVDALLDWRDKDDRTRPSGAEASQYQAAGLPYEPTNGSFRSVSELALVLGFAGPLYEWLRPLVTVHSRSSRVDSATAPRQVLEAVPGLDPGDVDEFLAARATWAAAEEDARGRFPSHLLAGAERYVGRSNAAVYAVNAEGESASGTIARRYAVVRLSGNSSRPYDTLAWLEFEVAVSKGADDGGSDVHPEIEPEGEEAEKGS